MLVMEILKVALSAVRANKLRSFLTMLGIIIGIAAVITMVALGEGAQRQVQERLERLGTNVLTVRPGQRRWRGLGREASLKVDDAVALRRDAEYVQELSPEMQSRYQVKFGATNANLEVSGIWPSYFDIQDHHVAAGRLFTASEDLGRRRVAVLGARVGEELEIERTATLVGQSLWIRGIPFEVIGVLAEKGDQGFNSPDENVYIPMGTAEFRVFGSESIRTIYAQVTSDREMNAALAEIDRVLRREHRLGPGDESDYNIRNQATLLNTYEETTRTFGFLLAGIAFISLIVGGIGIMNIMLVSVTERTREIGLRKALGARRREVLLQFLIEALVLCLAGGVIGVLVGAAGAFALQRLADWNTAIAPDSVIVALVFSGVVGLFFGLWPARRAASLDPIVALRHE